MEKKIKLLHVTSSLKVGGAEAVLCDLIRRLGNYEFEHQVIYFHEGPNLEKIKKMGIACHKVDGMFCLYDPAFFVKLFFLIKKLKPNVIHSLLWSANFASRLVAKLLKIPNVSAYHLDIYNDGVFRNTLDRMTRNFSTCIIAVADDVAASLGEFKNKNKLKVIKNGIDFCEIKKSQVKDIVKKQDLGFEHKDFIIGSVGRFTEQKNFQLLLRSFEKACKIKNNIRLVIVGLGPQEDCLRRLALELGLGNQVVFVVGKKACDYYQVFDCFVQSSIKEGLSIALLEAMSFELPCIVTNGNNGNIEHPVIKNLENGLIVETKNEHALCDALIKVSGSPVLYKDMAKKAKQDVLENFAIEGMISQYREVFANLSLFSIR